MKLTFKTTTVLLFAAIFSIHGLANTDTKQSDELAGAYKQATETTKNRVKKGKEKNNPFAKIEKNLIFETALFIKCIFQKKERRES